MSSATFRTVNKSRRREDNYVIPFINLVKFTEMEGYQNSICVIGGLGITCSPRDPRFAGSNPTEVDGFFQDVKILSTSSEFEISDSLKNLNLEKNGPLSKL